MHNLKSYAPSVLRYAMALVILWFGTQQFLSPSDWVAYVPDIAVSITHLSVLALVHVNATIEVVLGALLLFGWQTRIVAFVLSLHLLGIMYAVGYGQIAVRDFGLAAATFTIFMQGPDRLSID